MFTMRDILNIDARAAEEGAMPASTLRHKHVLLDQSKLDRARRILKAKTETEALHRALDIVVGEAEINAALRRVRGKATLRKIFR